jgi:hypothetical protein
LVAIMPPLPVVCSTALTGSAERDPAAAAAAMPALAAAALAIAEMACCDGRVRLVSSSACFCARSTLSLCWYSANSGELGCRSHAFCGCSCSTASN